MTSTNGASSSSLAAWRNGLRNSSPPSVGDSTLLWRWTFGSPGIAPRTTSSMPGWPAAVTETESPSQLMPSEIQRMWTSSTPRACVSAAMGQPSIRCQSVLQLERLDLELLPLRHLDVQASARRARQRERRERAPLAAGAAATGGGHGVEHQRRALRHRAATGQLERELERRRHHLAQVAHADVDLDHLPPGGMALHDREDALGDRELVHQQILGRGSPASRSITLRPPNAVATSTIAGGSVLTSPMSAASSHPGTERSAANAASARAGSTKATSLPSLATYIGSMPSSSAAPATSGRTGTSASRTIIATCEARASSLSADATPPRVASRMQRRCSPAASSSASTAGHRERVSDSIGASSSNSPRASMIAVPCSPTLPETRMRSPGRRAPVEVRARGSIRPRPVVHTYIASA